MTALTTSAPRAAPVEAPVPMRVQDSIAPVSNLPASRVALIFLGLALILGGIVRVLPLLSHPFVLNDGGLFWAMTRAIIEHNFALPARVTYPTLAPDLPFCYPPLGFYAAAALAKLGVPLTEVFRWLPWAWSVGTIWAFWRLARTVWRAEAQGEWAAGVATVAWALLPWSFVWMVMGGGLTRAPGLLLAFLAVEAALCLWRDGQVKKWLPLLLFLALALATHLERARFAVLAVGLVWLFYGRTWRSAVQLAGILVGAALLTAPWWGLCLARFGAAPFLAAASSGGSGWQNGSGLEKLVNSVAVGLGGEAILPLIHLTGGAGLLWCLWRRQWFVPAWFALILLLEVRSGRTFVLAPLALCAGILVANAPLVRVPFTGALALWGCLLSTVIGAQLFSLSRDDLAAIAWARHNAPLDARFLVMSKQNWATDAPGEWFPELAGRTSVLTVQGAEWLPDGEFRARWNRHSALHLRQFWPPVEATLARQGVKFDWVWRPDDAPDWTPGVGWKKVWSRGQNAIWRRTPSV